MTSTLFSISWHPMTSPFPKSSPMHTEHSHPMPYSDSTIRYKSLLLIPKVINML